MRFLVWGTHAARRAARRRARHLARASCPALWIGVAGQALAALWVVASPLMGMRDLPRSGTSAPSRSRNPSPTAGEAARRRAGGTQTSAPKHPEDPGRDPEGLDPPRDVLDAATGMPEEGGFTPPRGASTRSTTRRTAPPLDEGDR